MVATVKSETVTFRIRPEAKAALREAAEREHRSLANMLEVMIREYPKAVGADSRDHEHDRASRQQTGAARTPSRNLRRERSGCSKNGLP